MYRGAMRGLESNTQIYTHAQVYCTRTYEHTDTPTRLMNYTLMSCFEAEM